MKEIFVILSLFLLVTACKKCVDECEGPECPLPDGSYCPGNTINENNQCVCPENSIMLNDSLCLETLEDDTTWTRFYTTFDCECVSGDIIFGFADYIEFSGVYSLNEEFEPTEQVRIGGPFNFLPGASSSDFNARLHPAKCDGKDLYMHGSLNGDTLIYELFFINGSSLDTCGLFQILAL